MSNEYGLDYKYFEEKLSLIVRDASRYTPGEMLRELSKYVEVARCSMKEPPLSVEQQAARIKELKVENEALRMLIINHNNACLSSCNARSEDNKVCDHYTARGRTCTNCPLDWAIEITQEIQLREGEQ